jgi:hypothetical protein
LQEDNGAPAELSHPYVVVLCCYYEKSVLFVINASFVTGSSTGLKSSFVCYLIRATLVVGYWSGSSVEGKQLAVTGLLLWQLLPGSIVACCHCTGWGC